VEPHFAAGAALGPRQSRGSFGVIILNDIDVVTERTWTDGTYHYPSVGRSPTQICAKLNRHEVGRQRQRRSGCGEAAVNRFDTYASEGGTMNRTRNSSSGPPTRAPVVEMKSRTRNVICSRS